MRRDSQKASGLQIFTVQPLWSWHLYNVGVSLYIAYAYSWQKIIIKACKYYFPFDSVVSTKLIV